MRSEAEVDHEHLMRLPPEDMVREVRMRVARHARSDRLGLASRDEDEAALLRARAVCVSRALWEELDAGCRLGREDDAAEAGRVT